MTNLQQSHADPSAKPCDSHALDEDSGVVVHSSEDFAKMRRAGRLAAETLDMITPQVRAGVTTLALDELCADFIASKGAQSACLGYRGFPRTTCISVNHVVCHGIPSSSKILAAGDIANIDVTVILDGWHGDSSRTYCVGQPKIKARRLVLTCYQALMAGIAVVRPGATLGDIGAAIQKISEDAGFSIVRDYCGHGLGRFFHGPPSVMHFGHPGAGLLLKEGMFFTIEPMLNCGNPDVLQLKDGWTVITRDKQLSAQFEHSIGVTASGAEIFTLSPQGYTRPPYD